MSDQPHSADYLSLETRDYWWNADFLALMAQRWRLSTVRTVLDVGCGMGHWGQLLLPHCAPDARLTGVDREAAWVTAAGVRAARRGLGARATYRRGSAESLPFPEGTFDFVTCQTVLIHVADPSAVLREMRRVLKPGGTLAVVEPVNMASSLVLGSTRFHDPVDEQVALLRFELICCRGKERLGLGNNSVGALLPKLFNALGLDEVRGWQWDKASWTVPPYADPEARATVAEAKDALAREHAIWGREETLRYFLAGGGAPEAFDAEWARARSALRRVVEAYERGEEHAVVAGVVVIASGQKPRER
jgi:SAM-dependent methyltransferase